MNKTASLSKERNFFSKEEKLKSKKRIDLLFQEGKSIRKKNLTCLYLSPVKPTDAVVQVMISVPKRLFRKATDRNLIKRRIREAYRLNKSALLKQCEEENQPLLLAFLYQNSTIEKYHMIENDIQKIVTELIAKLNKNKNPE